MHWTRTPGTAQPGLGASRPEVMQGFKDHVRDAEDPQLGAFTGPRVLHIKAGFRRCVQYIKHKGLKPMYLLDPQLYVCNTSTVKDPYPLVPSSLWKQIESRISPNYEI